MIFDLEINAKDYTSFIDIPISEIGECSGCLDNPTELKHSIVYRGLNYRYCDKCWELREKTQSIEDLWKLRGFNHNKEKETWIVRDGD